MNWRAAALLVLLAAGSGAARVEAACRETAFDGTDYTICEVDAGTADLRTFLYDGTGEVFGQFSAINGALAQDDKQLLFAMNGGMYHADRSPVGHYVEDGDELKGVIPNAGPGNFGLLPNGVFCIGETRADVFETLDYVKRTPQCRFATQSGPMLVIDGALHPRFIEDSPSRFVRNGVGTSADGRRVIFAISRRAVNFHSFARLFRDGLGLPNALYLDGKVSRLYAPQVGRKDFGFALGPIVGVVAPR